MIVRIRERPDLTAVFGSLSGDEMQALQDTLMAIDARIEALAGRFSEYAGVDFYYDDSSLCLIKRKDSAEITGVAVSKSSDLSFEITFPHYYEDIGDLQLPPPWSVTAIIHVQCDEECEDDPHELVHLTTHAETPTDALRALDAHIDELSNRVYDFRPNQLRKFVHGPSV